MTEEVVAILQTLATILTKLESMEKAGSQDREHRAKQDERLANLESYRDVSRGMQKAIIVGIGLLSAVLSIVGSVIALK